MKTILYSKIRKKKIDTPIKESEGKLVDVLVDDSEDYWEAEEVMIKTGMIKGDIVFLPTVDIEEIEEETNITIKKSLNNASEEPAKAFPIRLEDIKGYIVKNSEGEELGKVYDYEISTDVEPWIVWKLLVKPTNLSPLKRRARFSTEDVDKIEDEEIFLVKGYES